MALSNYNELQAAVRTEVSVTTSGLSADAITDAINRAEAKINRRARCREMEQLAYATYAAGAATIEARRLALPTGFLEMIHLWIKPATSADTSFVELKYVDPGRLWEYYDADNDLSRMRFTLRKQLEFSDVVSSDHEVMMHYLKRWDIATDSTNWLLTNFPDVYLYGALMECEAHLMNDARISIWKSLFDEAIAELNLLDERSRDDAELDTSEIAGMTQRGRFNILSG